MLIFSFLTAVIWALFVFYQTEARIRFVGLKIFLLHFLGGMIVLLLCYRFNHPITYLALGGIILIAGLRYISIIKQDLLSFLEKKIPASERVLIQSFSLFLCWPAFLGQSAENLIKNATYLLIFSLILAGLLQLFLNERILTRRLAWQKDLIVTLSGLFMVINSLIIMSGDVAFFLHIFEKILHIY